MGLMLATTTPLAGQTIRPLISEFKNVARGKVQLVNDAAWPLRIYVQAKSFAISDGGDVVDAPLDPRIRVKLSAMSMQIPPGESRFVFYEATAQQLPAWFVLYAVFTGFPSRDFKGLDMQVELPHVVYILPNQRLKQTEVRVTLVEFQRAARTIVLDVENTGANFGRILTTELRGPETKASTRGFALLPGGRRRLLLPWTLDHEPDSVLLKSRDFVLEQPLRTDRP